MSMDAVALVRIGLAELRVGLGGAEIELRGQNGMPFRADALDDATLVHTGMPLRDAAPDELGFAVRQLLGAVLDRHADERGILVFGSAIRPKAKTYAAVVDEIGDAGEWVPIVAADYLPERLRDAEPGSLEAVAGELMSQLGPEMMALQASLLGGNPAGLQEAMKMVGQLLADPAKAKVLMEAVAAVAPELPDQMPNLPPGIDLDAVQKQAQELANDPARAAELLEHLKGEPPKKGD
jgi:hypothetical protein